MQKLYIHRNPYLDIIYSLLRPVFGGIWDCRRLCGRSINCGKVADVVRGDCHLLSGHDVEAGPAAHWSLSCSMRPSI